MMRRGCLRAAGTVLAVFAGRGRAWAQRLLSQQEAGYRPTPNGIQSCGTCTLFIRPDGCRTVEGKVERTGWCRLYDGVD
jgi:hypothetical protein